MIEVVFLGTEAALLLALPVAYVISRLFARYAPHLMRWLLVGSAIFVTTIGASSLLDVSMRGIEADVFVFVAASVAYSFVFLFAFRFRPIMVRISALIVLGMPIALGYMAGTIGFLAVAFISGDVSSSIELHTKNGLLCRAEPFGNATTDVNGYFAHLIRPFGIMERKVFEERFVEPITPDEACSRAIATYSS